MPVNIADYSLFCMNAYYDFSGLPGQLTKTVQDSGSKFAEASADFLASIENINAEARSIRNDGKILAL